MVSATGVRALIEERGAAFEGYTFGFLDDMAKREIRCAIRRAWRSPATRRPSGHARCRSRAAGARAADYAGVRRGGRHHQGDRPGRRRGSVTRSTSAASSRRRLGARETLTTGEATLIVLPHRIPEERMTSGQILILQVPHPGAAASRRAVRRRRARDARRRGLRAHVARAVRGRGTQRRGDRGRGVSRAGERPLRHGPQPDPALGLPKLDQAETLFLFGAGREKRIYAVPPYTSVKPLEFEDFPFSIVHLPGCRAAAAARRTHTSSPRRRRDGSTLSVCSDASYCDDVLAGRTAGMSGSAPSSASSH